jgi:hypothetical protein
MGYGFLLISARDAQMLALAGLLAAWAILGPGHWLLRFLATPVCLAWWIFRWNGEFARWGVGDPFSESLLLTGALAAAVFRAADFRVRRAPLSMGRSRLRFSLLHLLIVTTAIAGLFGLLEALRPVLTLSPRAELILSTSAGTPATPIGLSVRQIIGGSAIAVAAFGGVWIMLRPGWVVLPGIFGLAASLPASSYLAQLTEAQGSFRFDAAEMALWLCAVGVTAAASVLPLRMVGYRLTGPPGAPGISGAEVSHGDHAGYGFIAVRMLPLTAVIALVGIALGRGATGVSQPLRLAEEWAGNAVTWRQGFSPRAQRPAGNEPLGGTPEFSVDPFARSENNAVPPPPDFDPFAAPPRRYDPDDPFTVPSR